MTYDISAFIKRNRYAFPKSFDMSQLTQEELAKVCYIEFKSPIAAWWLQFFLGGIGAGRFYIGDWKVGLAQAVLTFFFGIGILWVLFDLFQIRSITRERNMHKLEQALHGQVPTFGINLNIHNQ